MNLKPTELILRAPAKLLTDDAGDVLLEGISKVMQASDSPAERHRISGIVSHFLRFLSTTDLYLLQIVCVGPFKKPKRAEEKMDRAGGGESLLRYFFLSDLNRQTMEAEVAPHCLLHSLSKAQRKKKEKELERSECLNVRLQQMSNVESESKEVVAELQILGLSFFESPTKRKYEDCTEVFRRPPDNRFSIYLVPGQFTILLVLCNSRNAPVVFESSNCFDKRGCHVVLPYAAVCWAESSLLVQRFEARPREDSKPDRKHRRQEQAISSSARSKRVRVTAYPTSAAHSAQSDVSPFEIVSSPGGIEPQDVSYPSSSSISLSPPPALLDDYSSSFNRFPPYFSASC
jgi:hypothetical protein